MGINGYQNTVKLLHTTTSYTLPSVRYYNNLVPKLSSYHSRGEKKIHFPQNNVCCLSRIPPTELNKQTTAGAADLPTQHFHLHCGFCLSGPVSHHCHCWCDQQSTYLSTALYADTCRLQSNSDLSAVLQTLTSLKTYSSVLRGSQSVYCSILRFLNCTLTSFHIFC